MMPKKHHKCGHKEHGNPLRLDPSRTYMLRRAFVADVGRRFDLIRKKIWNLIAVQDHYGLRTMAINAGFNPDEPRDSHGQWTKGGGSVGAVGSAGADAPTRTREQWQTLVDTLRKSLLFKREVLQSYKNDTGWAVMRPDYHLIDMDGKMPLPKEGENNVVASNMVANAPYMFDTDNQKLKDFNRWLQWQIQMGILEVSPTDGEPLGMRPWMYKYIDSAYRLGLIRAYIDAHPELSATLPGAAMSRAAFLESSFGRPERTSKLRMMYTRTYEDLKGITAQMAAQMSRIFADAIAHGKGPMEVARTLSKTVSGITRQRANVLARTEIIHCHAEGQLDGYEDLGIDELGLDVEWSTSGGLKEGVCPKCFKNKGKVYTIKQARGVIPLHPNCVLGSSRILSPDPLTLMRTKYFGSIVELVTAHGCRLAVTEHHILLTQRGWVFAKDITDADYLFNASLLNGVSGVFCPDKNDGVPTIEDVSESLINKYHVAIYTTLSGTDHRENFHGDGRACDKKIDIMCLDGVLWNGVQSPVGRQCKESLLMAGCRSLDTSFALDRFRLLSSFLKRAVTSSDCLMRRLGIPSILIARTGSHQQSVSDRLGADQYPMINEDTSDQSAGQSVQNGKTQFSKPSGVQLAYLSLNLLGYMHSGLDKVVSIHCTPKNEGVPVYDVSTESTAYILDGVISSNCRCAWVSSIKLPKELQKYYHGL